MSCVGTANPAGRTDTVSALMKSLAAVRKATPFARTRRPLARATCGCRLRTMTGRPTTQGQLECSMRPAPAQESGVWHHPRLCTKAGTNPAQPQHSHRRLSLGARTPRPRLHPEVTQPMPDGRSGSAFAAACPFFPALCTLHVPMSSRRRCHSSWSARSPTCESWISSAHRA
eukprot:scaffold4528_cov86-Isochrysis_galbana.AAC.3